MLGPRCRHSTGPNGAAQQQAPLPCQQSLQLPSYDGIAERGPAQPQHACGRGAEKRTSSSQEGRDKRLVRSYEYRRR
jgi:hypothetical protein